MSVDAKMTALADEVRTLSGATDKLGLDEMASHTNEANAEVGTQTDLIQQLKITLQGKVAPGASEDLDDLLTEQEGLIADLLETLATKADGDGGTPTPIQEKTVDVTENGTVEVTPDEGYALSKVTANVNVPIPDGYITPIGTKEITENGPHDVTEYASVNVNVESGGDVARSIINKTITAYSDNEITTVGAYAFNGCSALTDVNLPKAKTVGGNAFQNCTSLTKLDLPKATQLNGYLVSGCSSLTELNMPNAESGRGFAIAGSKVEHLYLPEFTSPGSSVFRGATSLRTVYMPKLIKLEQYIFMGDTALETVTFPKVASVATQAMESCSALTYVDLPICKSINAKGFNKCSSLETLILRRTTDVCALANVSAFTGTPIASGTGFIYVPSALVDSYKSATNWSTFASQFRAIEDYPEICGGD